MILHFNYNFGSICQIKICNQVDQPIFAWILQIYLLELYLFQNCSILYIMFRQKKLTLNTPYNKINKVLWENKRINSQQLAENMQLKTHAQQLQRRVKQNSNEDQLNQKIIKKYEKLRQTYKRQSNFISSINNVIEERNYEELKNVVKKIENKLNVTATKTLKLQKKLKISIRNQGKKCDQLEQIYSQQNGIYYLQIEKNELYLNLQKKQNHLIEIELRNKELNKQVLSLITIRNKLREQAKQYDKSRKICTKMRPNDSLKKQNHPITTFN